MLTPKLEELEKQNIIKLRKYSYEENIKSHTKSYMFEHIPNLKYELNKIGIEILKSKIKSDELSKILLENKIYFEKYFENIYFVSINKHIQDYLSQNEDLIKYILKTHLNKNYE